MITRLALAATATGWAITGAYAARSHRDLRTDALTGLGNRLALREAFQRNKHCHRVGLLMLDLNGFKPINDTYGHRAGDQVLIEVARRLRGLQHRGQLAVRLSGDEFALWAGQVDVPESLDALGQSIAASIAAPMVIDGHTLTVTASIGTATTDGRHGRLEQLLEPADHAMYRDKRRHAATHRISPDVTAQPMRTREVA